MSVVAQHRWTVAQYLAKESAAETRSEFFQGEIFAMAGGSPAHNAIKDNLIIKIGSKLTGACRTYSSDQRVLIERTELFTYPDMVIVCGKPEFAVIDPASLINPQVIIEILSPSTERYDRTTKFRHYQLLSSFAEYLLVSQTEPLIEQFTRQADGSWLFHSFFGADATLKLATLPIEVPFADIYRDVEFPTTPATEPKPGI